MKAGKNKSGDGGEESDYRAFLIRCWCEGENRHFTLETIGNTRQQRHGFVGYKQLSAYLKKQFINEDGASGSDHQEGGGNE